MTRRASSASSARTDTRTSPRSVTDSGNCATPDAATDGMPFASSSPRTMLASTSDCVRKMTTRSDTSFHLQQNHRHVIVLRRVADERGDLAQDAFTQLVGRQIRMLFQN